MSMLAPQHTLHVLLYNEEATAQEAASGAYNMSDLVLPLPGFDVTYPPNDVGEFYTSFMASEKGGQLNPNDMRRKWRDISLSGGYRKIIAKPKGLHWEVKSYKLDEEKLVKTDLDVLIEKAKAEGDVEGLGGAEALLGAEKSNQTETENSAEDTEMREQHEEAKEKLAVVVRMQLGSSQYATMALRELTKGGAVAFRPDFQGPR